MTRDQSEPVRVVTWKALAKWVALVVGSAAPLGTVMWRHWTAAARAGVGTAVVTWIVAMVALEVWLLRARRTESLRDLTRGAVTQLLLTIVLSCFAGGFGLIVVYAPAALIGTLLSLLPWQVIGRVGAAPWVREFTGALGITLLCGLSHFLVALVVGSAIGAGTLPRSVVARRWHRSNRSETAKGRLRV